MDDVASDQGDMAPDAGIDTADSGSAAIGDLGTSGADSPSGAPVGAPEGIPEKFLRDGQVNVDALTKSYLELEKRFGAQDNKAEAPEAYELNVPEGHEIPEDDPVYSRFSAAAREIGLTQQQHDAVVQAFLEGTPEMQRMQMEAWQQNLNEEFKMLGPDADKRIKAIEGYARTHLPEGLAERVPGWLTSVEDVKAVETLMSKTRELRLPRRVDAMAATVDADKLREMRSAKNENGQLRMSVDPEYRAMVDRAYKEFYGEEPVSQVVSGFR